MAKSMPGVARLRGWTRPAGWLGWCRRLGGLWGLGAAVVAVSLVVLWHHSRTIQLGYETERMQAEKSRLERIHRELVIERESLASLERVERLAGDLGLVHPSPRDMVVVKVEPPASHDEPAFAIAFGRRVLPAEAHAAP